MSKANKIADQLDLLEDDDEFEEFENTEIDTAQGSNVKSDSWTDNWDDEEVDVAFAEQLRAELEKSKLNPQ
eukprot:ANDGO_03551.mRNA.1 hypothetical protein